MTRLIKIHDIAEFSEIGIIPDTAITDVILTNVRNLDEKEEIERFVREILYDPNETPHGPTEIADILTTHVHVNGKKQLAAFVLKGRSFLKVTSRNVTHQFARLRQIPKLDLIVFGAVGHIQDDAQRDFMQVALDGKCDYLIIDAQDWARLLIAYEKICGKDGTTFNNMGACKEGHTLDVGQTIEIRIREKRQYSIIDQSDISHAGAKRYSAKILLDRHYGKSIIRSIIEEATEKLKYSNYYRNERTKARWGKTTAHVVWLFIAYDLDDIANANWVCRTSWIDPYLREDMRPLGLDGDEKLGEIEIDWNDQYKEHRDFLESMSGNKEQVLDATRPLLKKMTDIAKIAIGYFNEYNCGRLSEKEFIKKMQEMEPKENKLYLKSGNIPLPPEDCKDYDQACQNIFATIDNMFLYFSETGLRTWEKPNRDWLMQDTIKRFYDDLRRIEFEGSKIQ